MELSFLLGVDASHVYVRALALGCFHSDISTRTFRRALISLMVSVDVKHHVYLLTEGADRVGFISARR